MTKAMTKSRLLFVCFSVLPVLPVVSIRPVVRGGQSGNKQQRGEGIPIGYEYGWQPYGIDRESVQNSALVYGCLCSGALHFPDLYSSDCDVYKSVVSGADLACADFKLTSIPSLSCDVRLLALPIVFSRSRTQFECFGSQEYGPQGYVSSTPSMATYSLYQAREAHVLFAWQGLRPNFCASLDRETPYTSIPNPGATPYDSVFPVVKRLKGVLRQKLAGLFDMATRGIFPGEAREVGGTDPLWALA